MMDLVPFEDDPSIGRDPKTGAVLNANKEAYESHIRMKRNKVQAESRIKHLEEEMSEIKSSLSTILELLKNGSNRSQ